MLENLMSAIESVKEGEYRVTVTKSGGEQIHQTERNQIGALLRNALSRDLAVLFPASDESGAVVAYVTADGAILEIPNESICNKVSNPDGSGAISVEFSVKVKGLDYNAKDASDAYQIDLAEKMAKAQAKAENKAKKIAQDTVTRAKKKKEGV